MEDRKLAAIMFTDLVGFSHQLGVDEPHALQLLDKHNDILHQSIEQFKGHTLKHIGDSVFAEFESSTNAVNCAIDIQTRLKASIRVIRRLSATLSTVQNGAYVETSSR